MKQILFLGQAPAKPASKHEVPGTYLHAWLHLIGLNEHTIKNNCHFYALVNTFPGSTKNGHLPPTSQQIQAHRPILVQALQTIQPAIIIPVGKLAIAETLNEKDVKLQEVIGRQYLINPFQALQNPIACIPFSHPSGRSAWNHTHKAHVQKALQLLKQELT